MAWRLMHNPHLKADYAGTVKKLPNGKIVWTGQVNMLEKRLMEPCNVSRGTIWFVDSMSDLFHEKIPFSYIDKVFAVMAICPHHIFQVLTKRPERMLEYFNHKDKSWKNEGMQGDERIRFQCYHHFGKNITAENWQWPLPNVWLGVSVEDQKAADQRIPLLLQTPAAIRFLSCEPLIGQVDLIPPMGYPIPGTKDYKPAIDWVICGGESGPDARPMHPDWARILRDQCQAAGIAFFFKQWGGWAPVDEVDPSHDVLLDKKIEYLCLNHAGQTSKIANEVIAENEENCILYKFGKHTSGRKLDGREWNEYPKNKIWNTETLLQ
jgi:protein gp37